MKALLVQSKLNVPFAGGLSSYSAFLLVLAAYDRCQYIDDRQALFTRWKGPGGSFAASLSPSTGCTDAEDHYNSDRMGAGMGAGSVPTLPVTEGEVLMHFLTLYALKSTVFNPLTQSIGKSKNVESI